MPSAKKLIARSMRRRRGAAASVDGKSEKVAVSFGAYLLCKSCSPSRAPAATEEKLKGRLYQAPSSHTQ
jgi:hypothetical protein